MKPEIEVKVEKLPVATKRICLALDLQNDAEKIAQYRHYHGDGHWQEISCGIRAAGIVLMDIYNVDNRLFMICEVEAHTDFDAAWDQTSTYERQDKWAELMATFQQALPGHTLKWVKMERIFSL